MLAGLEAGALADLSLEPSGSAGSLAQGGSPSGTEHPYLRADTPGSVEGETDGQHFAKTCRALGTAKRL